MVAVALAKTLACQAKMLLAALPAKDVPVALFHALICTTREVVEAVPVISKTYQPLPIFVTLTDPVLLSIAPVERFTYTSAVIAPVRIN